MLTKRRKEVKENKTNVYIEEINELNNKVDIANLEIEQLKKDKFDLEGKLLEADIQENQFKM